MIAVSEYGVARGAGGIVCNDQFDVEEEVFPGFVGVVGLAITLWSMEYGENMDVPSASMTLFLVAVSVGR